MLGYYESRRCACPKWSALLTLMLAEPGTLCFISCRLDMTTCASGLPRTAWASRVFHMDRSIHQSMQDLAVDVPLAPFAIVMLGRGSLHDCAGGGSTHSPIEERARRYRYWKCIGRYMCSLRRAIVCRRVCSSIGRRFEDSSGPTGMTPARCMSWGGVQVEGCKFSIEVKESKCWVYT